MTYHNQIDYTKFQDCEDNDQANNYLANCREWKKEEAAKAKKEACKKARHIAYWKPEAIEKRRIAKELYRKEAAELYEKRMKETIKVVSNMFRGMF